MGIGSWIRGALGRATPRRPDPYTPLRVTPLEERRMLDGAFALNAGVSLTLDDFTETSAEDLSISDDGTHYVFTLAEGDWSGTEVAGVVEVDDFDSSVLRVNKSDANALTSGILIDDNGNGGAGIDVDVNFDDADFSALSGTLELESVGDVTQTAATTLKVRALDVDALSVDLQQNSNDFDDLLAASAGAIALVDTDEITLEGITAGGSVSITADEVDIDGAVSAMGDIDIAGSTSILSTAAGTIDSNGNDVTLKSNDITLGAAVTSTGGGGTVTILPNNVTDTIGLGSPAGGTLNLSEATLDQVQGGVNGFSELVIGYPGIGMTGTEQQGDITLNNGGGGLSINLDLSLRLRAGSTNSGDPGKVWILDTLMLSGTGGVYVEGSGSTTLLAADMLTAGGPVFINDSVLVDGVRTIETDGGNLVAAGPVTITGPIDGANAGGTDTLTIDAARGASDGIGDAAVDLQGPVEGDAATNNIPGGADLEGLTIRAGQVDLADVHLEGPLDVTGTNIDLNGSTYQVDGNGGAETIAFNGPVDLAGDVAVVGAGGAGDDVTFNGTLDGAFGLTVNAGPMGDVDFLGIVGGTTPLTSLSVTSADDVTFVDDVIVAGAVNVAAQSTVDVMADMSAAGNVTMDANTGDFNLAPGGSITTVAGDVQLSAGGMLTVDGPVTNTGDGDLTLIAGDDLVLRANLFTGDGMAGNDDGKIRGTAGANIVVAAGVLVTTDTGQISDAYFAPLVVDVRVPTDFGHPDVQTDVDSLGRTFVEITIQDPLGTNFEVLIDWSDGTVDQYPPTVLTSPVVTNDVFFATATAPPVNGGIAYLLPHQYFGNPDADDPANNIPFTILVRADFRGAGGDDNGIQFVENAALGGEVVGGSADGELTVPGDGLFAIIVVQPATIEVNPGRPPQVVGLEQLPAPPTVPEFRPPDDAVAAIDTRAIEDTVVVVRVFAPDGTVKRDVIFPLQVLEELPALYKELRNGYFEIYLKDGRTGRLRLIVPKFFLRDGKVVEEAELQDNPDNPAAAPPNKPPAEAAQQPRGALPPQGEGVARQIDAAEDVEQATAGAAAAPESPAADVAEPAGEREENRWQAYAGGTFAAGVLLGSAWRRRGKQHAAWAACVDRVFAQADQLDDCESRPWCRSA